MFKFGNSQGSLEKWLILGLGQGTYKISLEYFLVSENIDLASSLPNDVGTSEEHRNQLNHQSPNTKAEQFKQQNEVVVDYKPTYKINESILI